MTGVILAGAVTGLGVLMLVMALAHPAARGSGAVSALARLDRDLARSRGQLGQGSQLNREANVATTTALRSGTARLERGGRVLRAALDDAGLRLPRGLLSDLNLTNRSLELHLALTVVGAGLGILLPLVVASVLATLFTSIPLSTPLWAAGLGLLIGALLPTARVIARADMRRRDFRHVVGSFLDLVALNLAGGRGVPEALTSASRISDGWAMVRLRDTLEIARLHGETPWSALGRLGEQTGVVQLRDLSAALELVADDGAKVRESLTARAASLRRRELADAESRAQARSQSMLVAQLLLAVGFLLFLIYPAVTRVLST
jgi:Flp pilus assembly protein TadB